MHSIEEGFARLKSEEENIISMNIQKQKQTNQVQPNPN